MLRTFSIPVSIGAALVLGACSSKEDPDSGKSTPSGPTVVEIETSMGSIKVELDAEKAPITVENFLDYVDDGHFDGTAFHRVIKDFMIQGGGFAATDGKLVKKPTRRPINNEATNGLHNTRGTIAMARTNDPDSATAQFFINVVDNTRGLGPGGFSPDGYTVFGKVIAGIEVVDQIRAVETGTRPLTSLTPDGRQVSQPAPDVPLADVVIKSIRRVDG